MNYTDIYFDKNYGKLYEQAENGEAIYWTYVGEEGKVINQFIKRKIPCDSKNEFYDIVTPYGYGGPIIESINEGYTKQQLVEAFETSFSDYCEKNKIVSEFVRFHPICNNALDFQNIYNSQCIRQTLGTNLKDYEDPVIEEFSKGCRKNIRRAIANGISWKVTKAPHDIKNFREIYYSTMNRNNASEFYYFNDKYFQDCMNFFKDNILLVEAIYEEKTIAAGFYFVFEETIHIHLSGTLTEYLYLSPAYILRYATTIWGKENGFSLIHHGGGRSNSVDDSLYLFKKQFAQKTNFDFYIGKKIWNKKKYDELCEATGVDKNTDFFPAYRLVTN